MARKESLIKYWFDLITNPKGKDHDSETRDETDSLDTQAPTPETPTPLGEDE